MKEPKIRIFKIETTYKGKTQKRHFYESLESFLIWAEKHSNRCYGFYKLKLYEFQDGEWIPVDINGNPI